MNIFQKLMAAILPFIVLGMIVVIIAFGFLLFFYLLLFGTLVGLVLFAISWVREKLFASKQMSKSDRPGRIIDHDKK